MTSQLISQLGISSAFIDKLIADPYKFYIKKKRPKMKFGREQLDGDGQPRMRNTLAPISFLKFKQRQIKTLLQKIKLPNSMFGGVAERNNIQNALQHISANFFFTVDLKNFFSNISNKHVNRSLRDNGLSWEDARVITKLCTMDRCLPQGAPTSSILANIVFSSTAKLLEEFCGERGITFTAFVDDLTFSAKYDFTVYKDQILKIIIQSGFVPNYKKIHFRHRSCEITGLIVRGGKLCLEKRMRNQLNNPKIKAYLVNIAKHYARYSLS